ncbi:MAG TPA: hypothetical protein VG013_29820 [Gemmataceae bacterium]|nr:hypothetical protein [Gemmataceae bacterium]
MIARQRDNLRSTFAQVEAPAADAQSARRLAGKERDLAAATAEFTRGIERSGPVPCLHQAREAMDSAAAALGQRQLQPAGGFEETALAGLIQARKNLRQMLSQSNRSSSQCRKFDTQQRQKLRTPPQKDDKEQAARLQREIEKLAQLEKKLAEDIAARCDCAQPGQQGQESPKNNRAARTKGQSSSGSSSRGGQSSAKAGDDLAESQEQAAQNAATLQRLMRKDEALTDLARERMDKAADDIRDSATSLRGGRDRQAGKQAAEAAQRLERLARHVAGLKARELAEKLAHNQSLARRLARQQQELAKGLPTGGRSSSAGRQAAGRRAAAAERGLAAEARTLDDLLKRLQQDAAEGNGQLARDLRQVGEANPPQAVVQHMQRAGSALQAGRTGEARPDMDQAAGKLAALAQELEAARHGLIQPQLDKLLAAEKQAAEAQKTLRAVKNDGQKAEAEKKMGDLRDTLESLKPPDGKLAEATAALADAVRHGGGGWGWRKKDPWHGAYVPPQEYEKGLHRVIQLLQVNIQEIILMDALLDKDEPVPPQYQALVEEYYKVLSEDLR